MQVHTLVLLLDQPESAAEILRGWRVSDPLAARHLLIDLAEAGIPLDLLSTLCAQLAELLRGAAEPDRVLDDLRQFIITSRSPLSFAALVERDATALPLLVRVLDWGGVWRETILRDPETFDLLRLTEGQPVEREPLVAEIGAEVASLHDERSVLAALRRIKRREQLRIVYGERLAKHRPELVWQQLTYLAEALVAAALSAAQRRAPQPLATGLQRRPTALGSVSVIALGRCGGAEMDYSDRLQLLLLHEPLPAGDALRRAAQDQYDRLARALLRLLNEDTDLGMAYHVELQSLPGREVPPQTIAIDEAAALLDSLGRTWHRQAFMPARCIAGDHELAERFWQQIEPWIYRRLLSPADEAGLRALKRRIVRRAEMVLTHDTSEMDIELAPGGLFDFEQTLQFLRLLRGGDQPGVRQRETLPAIAGLEQADAISVAERTALEEAFVWLRRQLHEQQNSPATGIAPDRARLQQIWELLRSLLQAAFADEAEPPAEVDLLLSPHPSPAEADQILAPYHFQDCAAALAHLNDLASERSAFLSTRRCRYYLSSIVGPLLSAIARTPQPDATLANLSRVSDSLGGKGVLWELFQAHPPSLELYVRVCGCSPYLSDLLISNPGMLDELVDSLQLSRQPTRADLERNWLELRRSSDAPLSLLSGLKASRHLQIGVRDILQREPIDATLAALSDVADVCLGAIAQQEYDRLVEKHGTPTIAGGPFDGEPCGFVVLGLGKLGGQEPNYHSDLQVAFLYEAEGETRPAERVKRVQSTSNGHFFTQLAQRILKELAQTTPQGRLYPIEATFRPLGSAGPLAISLPDFSAHFQTGAAPFWQWQALCRARPVFGPATARAAVTRTIRQLITSRPWQASDAAQLLSARLHTEQGASPLNIKRGSGGTLDVELIVQRTQLEHAVQHPEILEPNTLAALGAIASAGLLSQDEVDNLSQAYRLLRRIECGIRLMNSRARHELPSNPVDLHRLAILLGYESPEALHEAYAQTLNENRARLLQLNWHEASE
jgi:glutamate-ammonia-ligase adenylyltransferase